MMTYHTGNVELDQKIEEWLKWDQNEKTRSVIKSLAENKAVDKLEKLLLNRQTFGTAGIRGVMGAGYASMNDLVIIQTTQGLVAYLEKVVPDVKEKGIVIGHDARHNSHRFSRLAASICASRGILVYLYSDIVPTPFVPFCVLQKGCAVGIMITASHNPKEDNGYKVYWSNGPQIIPPHDRNIQNSILENLEPWKHSWDTTYIENNPLCKDPLDEIKAKYFEQISSSLVFPELCKQCSTVFTYTAMHGVSHRYITEAFKVCGFQNYIPVKEQMEPDPDFPTVKFPNPEEGKSALDLSMQTADANNSRVILANDPDADRLAIAEKQPNGSWKVFTGNETGALLGWWLWFSHLQKNPDCKRSDAYMISSTVSSKILRTLAQAEGFSFIETLTGFKWMGNKACELMAQGKTVLFAFEEAIGFMCGTGVLDKDGVGAAMAFAQIAAYTASLGRSLQEQLEYIYTKYGYHTCKNSYYLCYHQPTICKMFDRLRNFDGPQTYPKTLGPYAVVGVRDLTTGYDSTQPDGKALLPTTKPSEMITFYFENGCVATIRTSGTEPKIKYYTELIAPPEQRDWKTVDMDLDNLVSRMLEEWMQPEVNGLLPRPE